MNTTYTLPVAPLPPSTVFLPGVLYRSALLASRAAALLLPLPHLDAGVLQALALQPLVKLEPATVAGMAAAAKALGSAGPVVFCAQGSIGTVVRIAAVEQADDAFVVTFHALARGRIVAQAAPDTVTQLPVELLTTASGDVTALVTAFQELVPQVAAFVAAFPTAPQPQLPLAHILHLQFAAPEFQLAFARLTEMYKKPSRALPDVTAAVLPLPFAARLEVLETLDFAARVALVVAKVEAYVEFCRAAAAAGAYVEAFMALASDAERARFMASQLSSLRNVVGAKPGAGGAPQRRATAPDDDELKHVAAFVARLPQIASLSPDARRLLEMDFRKLQRMPPQQSEWHVLRGFFDVVVDVPLGVVVEGDLAALDLREVMRQLDRDSHGLAAVKRRLVQYLAVVRQHARTAAATAAAPITGAADSLPAAGQITAGQITAPGSLPGVSGSAPRPAVRAGVGAGVRAPILLLGGPPGVGKTSLARSLAAALQRPFQRISLGGVRDESEIRGHRRTYVGALPGAIVQALRQARCMNPVILLDEIDKVAGGAGAAGRGAGDPAAALLEVLDPEQNGSFVDHYLGFAVDLSQVVFVCTANDAGALARPLLDRMEYLAIPAYGPEEKLAIARDFLLPRQIARNGLGARGVAMADPVLRRVIDDYTAEAGVRALERTLGAICRAKTVELDEGAYLARVALEDLPRYLGLPPIADTTPFAPGRAVPPGVVAGLSYNSGGAGGVLVFEAVGLPGTGSSLHMTGRLGAVLTESGTIAMAHVRALLPQRAAPAVLAAFDATEVHLHVPQGAVSKDGPSAGITMALAFLSLALKRPVPADVAMTGEITLLGQVLPIGGVSEKLLGASRAGLKRVLLPRANRRDVAEAYCAFHTPADLLGVYGDGALLREFAAEEAAGVLYSAPERWVRARLGLTLVYVTSFTEVVDAVWGSALESRL